MAERLSQFEEYYQIHNYSTLTAVGKLIFVDGFFVFSQRIYHDTKILVEKIVEKTKIKKEMGDRYRIIIM